MPLRRTPQPRDGEAGFGVEPRRRGVYVVFQEMQSRPWWRFWTAPGFRHVWAFAPVFYPHEGVLGARYTVKFEPLSWGLDWTTIWFEPPPRVAQSFLQAGVGCIVQIAVDFPPPGKPPLMRGPMTCVGLMKAALGIRAPWIWTPHQLCVYLLRHGGTLIEREDDGRG